MMIDGSRSEADHLHRQPGHVARAKPGRRHHRALPGPGFGGRDHDARATWVLARTR